MFKCKCCSKPCQSTLCKDCYKPFEQSDSEKSFAFTEIIPTNEEIKDCTVLDFFNSTIQTVDFSGFKNLTKLRLSHCNKLKTVILKDLPNLKVLDLSGSFCTEQLDFSGSDNIVSFDCSFCASLKSFKGKLLKCEYFSISSTNIEEIPLLPEAKYINVSVTGIKNLKPLKKAMKCQFLNITDTPHIKTFDFSDFKELTELSTFFTNVQTLKFKKLSENSKLANVWCNRSVCDVIPDINGSILNDKLYGHKFEFPICSGDWHNSHRLLYGPWPSPPNDFEPRVKCDVKYPVPENVDKKLVSDLIAGVFFGCPHGR